MIECEMDDGSFDIGEIMADLAVLMKIGVVAKRNDEWCVDFGFPD